MNSKTGSVQMVDRNGQFVRWVSFPEAEELVARARAVWRSRGRRLKISLLSRQTVEQYRGSIGRPEKPYYREFYSGHPLVVLKRVNPATGQLVRWHPDLTFEDARAGRMRPQRRRGTVDASRQVPERAMPEEKAA
jgi:hypothetical protein